MKSNETNNDFLDIFFASFEKFKRNISHYKSKRVNALDLRNQGKDCVFLYFRDTRPHIINQIKSETILKETDQLMQKLLILTRRRSSTSLYKKILSLLNDSIYKLIIAREIELSNLLVNQARENKIEFSNLEKAIFETLKQLVPSTALSYQQALFDLYGPLRISYKGVAHELREALRVTLDYLAPDQDVVKQLGFKLEKDTTKPTMKQKVQFILRARGSSRSNSEVTEKSVDIINGINENIASLTRKSYSRASNSAHTGTIKPEVQQFKNYVDSVLAEILSIYSITNK